MQVDENRHGRYCEGIAEKKRSSGNEKLIFNAESFAVTVGNTPGAALPNTGGPGTDLIYLFGIMLTGLAGTGLVMKRRRRDAA